MQKHLPFLPLNRAETKRALSRLPEAAVDARVLFAGGSEVVIHHGIEVYRLRLTRQNKLILTK